jgi:dolichol-phosphate mannosyltransferase
MDHEPANTMSNSLKLSIVIPAHNEEQNIGPCIDELTSTLRHADIPYEFVIVNDNSSDGTADVVRQRMELDGNIQLVNRHPPGGFGRAVRSGLEQITGDVVVIYMADLSDNPEDVVAYYHKIEEGYDCVFGSRFVHGAHVEHYPFVKRICNRLANHAIRLLFRTKFNDLTNAFKAYRSEVIHVCGPYRASHFNITIEMSLSALNRNYKIAQIPISWYGRTWGSSKLRLTEMGRRYLSTLLMLFFERILISDDIVADGRAKLAELDRARQAAKPSASTVASGVAVSLRE